METVGGLVTRKSKDKSKSEATVSSASREYIMLVLYIL